MKGKYIIIGAILGYAVAYYMCNRKHKVNSVFNRQIDDIKANITDFLNSTGTEGDCNHIANDLVNGRTQTAVENYSGIQSKRYVLN